MSDTAVVPLGTRFRKTLSQLASLTYQAGGTSTLDLPKTLLQRALTLRFRGTATIGTATAVAIAEGILATIKKIELVGDGRDTIWAIDNASGFRLSNLLMGKMGELDPPVLTVGARPFFWTYQLHHEAMGMRQPNDSFLDPRQYEQLQLRITWAGADTEVITPGGGGTAVVTGTLDLILEQTAVGDGSIIARRVLNFREDSIAATSSNLSVPVSRNGILTGILFKTTRDGVPVDNIINKVSLRSDSTFLHIDGLRWDMLQTLNAIEHGLDRPASAAGATGYASTFDPDEIGTGIEGYAFLPLCEDGMISTGLNTLALNTTELILDVTRTSGTELIRTTYVWFVPRDVS